jgi:hypothetical protein
MNTTNTAYLPPIEQSPGCLPKGFGLDSLLTISQFAVWQQRTICWVRAHMRAIPGFIVESREHVVVHPRTYLEKRLKTKISVP